MLFFFKIKDPVELQRFVKQRGSTVSSANKFRKSDVSEIEINSSQTRSKRSQSFYEKKIQINEEIIQELINGGAQTQRNNDNNFKDKKLFDEILSGFPCFHQKEQDHKINVFR